MMLGVTGIDGGAAAAEAESHQESGGGGGGGDCVMEFGEHRSAAGGNRWPRQETMALLKIRSEMDAAFRDSSLKGPLWEQVSRKMVELGYKRNAKKCREKFENVFKYHKRTKEGRSSKSEGKTYKFFEQLAALENVTTPPSQSSVQHFLPPPPPHSTVQMQVVHADPISVLPPASRATTPSNNITAAQPSHHHHQQPQQPQTYANISSSSSSDEDMERRRKRKRKEEEYLREVMKGVIEKQVELQKKFLETLEKKDRERMTREEAWRNQEMERIKREFDVLAQERSMAAARHSSLVSFLEKMTHQNQIAFRIEPDEFMNAVSHPPPPPPPPPPTVVLPQPAATLKASPPMFAVPQLALTLTPPPRAAAPQPALITSPSPPPVVSPPPVMVPPPEVLPGAVAGPIILAPQDHNGGGESTMSTTSSRWPKAEIEALIKIRSSLDNKYQENGPKGPLWEEVSIEMNNLGYNRSSKRCKEKWENINKYFKKVKDNNKKRSEASKTCPYFYQLDALYKEKAKGSSITSDLNYSSYASAVNPDNPMARHDEDPGREDIEYDQEAEAGGHE